MMDPEPIIEKLFHLLISTRPDVPPEHVEHRMLLAQKVVQTAISHGGFAQRLRGFYCLFAGVNEDHNLMAFLDELRDLFERYAFQIFLGG